MIALEVTIDASALNIDRDVDKLEEELAYRIVDEARTLIDTSVPAGRLYRRGSFRRGESRGLNTGFRRRARGSGVRIHRASAPGQPPAEDTGRTYRDISVRRMAQGKYRIRFGGAAGYLEVGVNAPSTRSMYHEGAALAMMGPHRGGMRARPFIIPAIEIAAEKTFG